MALEWKVPPLYQRTTCVKHLKLEHAGGADDFVREDYFPILDLRSDAEATSHSDAEEGSGHHHGTGTGEWSPFHLPRSFCSLIWNWSKTKPFHSLSDPALCGRENFAWHPNLTVLAAVCADSIMVYDKQALRRGGDGEEIRGLPSTQYFCVAFRPNSPGDIAAGSNYGLQIFTKSLPQLTKSKLVCHVSGEYGMRNLGSGKIDCISWHPMGHLVACAGPSTSGFTVWDADTCEAGSRMGMAMERINWLKWSPCGNYIAAASQGRKFYLWDTTKWNVQSWDCGKWGNVVSGEWDPLGRFVLLSFGKTQKLMVVHITQEPPALNTQWNVLDLPQLCPTNRNTCDGHQDDSGCVDWMTWDPSGARMAVALKAPHAAQGCIAIFDTVIARGLNPMFIGYARTHPNIVGDNRCSRTYMAFQKHCEQGALLGVRQGREISFLPMVYKQI